MYDGLMHSHDVKLSLQCKLVFISTQESYFSHWFFILQRVSVVKALYLLQSYEHWIIMK